MKSQSSVLEAAASRLGEVGSQLSAKMAFVGFDGFVDRITRLIDQRGEAGAPHKEIEQMRQFGERIVASAGKSTNIEMRVQVEKLGGNGPIMANSLSVTGVTVRYAGMLGRPIHPVFEEFARKTEAVSLGEAGITTALEFDDGKIMLGEMSDYDHLDYGRIVSTVGEGKFFDLIAKADLIGMVNWTMTPAMNSIYQSFLLSVLPNIPPKDGGRVFFFDFCDPKKRSIEDLAGALKLISQFQNHGRVVLGLNLSEAQHTAQALSFSLKESDPASLKLAASRIREALSISCVVIHPREGAACATRDEAVYLDGPVCAEPLISTGAGDHFNSGFATAYLLGLEAGHCLAVAMAFSGQYVRTARSPGVSETVSFIKTWAQGGLS